LPDQIGFQPNIGLGCTSAPTRLTFSQQPSHGRVDVAIAPQPVVRAEDDEGNLAINFNGWIQLSIDNNPGGGVLLGQSMIRAQDGVAEYQNMFINQPGTGYTLVAISTDHSLDPALSVLFNVLPRSADLQIGMTPAPNPVTAGQALVYTLKVNNLGPSSAENVRITFNMPTGAELLSTSGTGWTCTQVGRVLNCTFATLASGTFADDLLVNFNAPTTLGVARATAAVVSNISDPVAANNTAESVVLVVDIPVAGGTVLYLPIIRR